MLFKLETQGGTAGEYATPEKAVEAWFRTYANYADAAIEAKNDEAKEKLYSWYLAEAGKRDSKIKIWSERYNVRIDHTVMRALARYRIIRYQTMEHAGAGKHATIFSRRFVDCGKDVIREIMIMAISEADYLEYENQRLRRENERLAA